VSMRTRDGYVEALFGFGRWLLDTERWGSNPFGKLRKEARESDRRMEHRAFDVEELCKLVEAAEVRGPQQWRRTHPDATEDDLAQLARDGAARGTLYVFAAYCGLRLSECTALQWSAVVLDGDDTHVTVRAESAKNRTEQRVPLMPWVVERLREHRKTQKADALRAGESIPDGSARVFTIRRGLLDSMRKDANWAGLGERDPHGRRTTFHGLRASTATLLARAGVTPAVAMQVMRHADPRLTLKTYAKLNPGDLRAELIAKLKAPRIASTPASNNSAPERAAVGCSAPLAQAGSAIADHLGAQERRGLAPDDAGPFRSVPQPGEDGGSGGRCRSRTCDPQLVELML
jgi:integrase